ncbi:MAG: enolase C-terminal domain-like protein [Halolamina sp.]
MPDPDPNTNPNRNSNANGDADSDRDTDPHAEPDAHRLRSFDVTLSSPLSTAAGTIDRRRGFLLRVADGDRVGVGEAAPLPGWTESYDECEAALRRAIEAANGGFPEPVDLPDPEATPAARHAVESAVADARARAAGESLAARLARVGPFDADVAPSPPPADAVPVNATVGDDDLAGTVAAAESAVAAGFETLKLKLGARPWPADRRRVEAVREACPGATLRVDANCAWDRETAADALEGLAAADVTVVEQPVAAADLDALGSLAGHADGPLVAADEALALTEHSPDRVAAAADLLVCKPMALGGPMAALEAAATARAAGGDAVVTTTVDAAVARAAAVAVAAAIPDVRACGLATASLLGADVAPDPAPVREGVAPVPTGPGAGVDLLNAVADSGP